MAENPWTNLAGAAGELKTPKSVLNEQAGLLASSTERKICGRVKTNRGDGGRVFLELDAYIPTLGGYSVTLVSANHSPHLYPCSVGSSWIEQPDRDAKDAEQLAQYLVAILKTPELQKLVVALYAQARG